MSRLYLIDDHAIVREGLRAVFNNGGHAVIAYRVLRGKANELRYA